VVYLLSTGLTNVVFAHPFTRRYVHTRRTDVVVVKLSPLYQRLRGEIDAVIESAAGRLASRSDGALRVTSAKSLTHFVVMQARKVYVTSQGNRGKDECVPPRIAAVSLQFVYSTSSAFQMMVCWGAMPSVSFSAVLCRSACPQNLTRPPPPPPAHTHTPHTAV
jgi:hypothetical protein